MVATLTAPVPVRNKVGRPRAFQDEDVYRVMVDVISHVGYSGLTFALIAAQIHCTTSALIRRFGDKQALVNGFIAWLSTGTNDETTAYLNSLDPLERIEARWMMPRTNTKNGIRSSFSPFSSKRGAIRHTAPELAIWECDSNVQSSVISTTQSLGDRSRRPTRLNSATRSFARSWDVSPCGWIISGDRSAAQSIAHSPMCLRHIKPE